MGANGCSSAQFSAVEVSKVGGIIEEFVGTVIAL